MGSEGRQCNSAESMQVQPVHACIIAGKHAIYCSQCFMLVAAVTANALAQGSMGAQPVHQCVKQRVTSFESVAIDSDHWIRHYLTHLTSHRSSPPVTESQRASGKRAREPAGCYVESYGAHEV